MIILAPGCTHFDRIDPRTQRKMSLGYRTYRLQARCVFELFCAFLTTRGKGKARPALLIGSFASRAPSWISPLECQKLAVGTSLFQCCESNHSTVKECRRPLFLTSLEYMIELKSQSLFLESKTNILEARMTRSLTPFWTRGLTDERTQKSWDSLDEFKRDLKWNIIDTLKHNNVPLLIFAVTTGSSKLVRETLSVNKNVNAKLPQDGIVNLGLTGNMSALMIAMFVADSESVSLLLKHGADPYATDIKGFNSLMFASISGRTNNVKFWLHRFPGWDIEKKNKITGATCLLQAVTFGTQRRELVKVLLDFGARPGTFLLSFFLSLSLSHTHTHTLTHTHTHTHNTSSTPQLTHNLF